MDKQNLNDWVELIENAYPGLPNARWLALRLLDGDRRIEEALRNGELAELSGIGFDEEGTSAGLKLEMAT